MEALKAKLVRDGRIRFAINLGNTTLAQQDEASGELTGVSVALARDLAERLSAEPAFVVYSGAGKVVDDAGAGRWDVAFLAIDDKRREVIAYSSPYVIIEAKAVVRAGSPLRHVSELDSAGVRLLVSRGSAYDLYLTKAASKLSLHRSDTPAESFAAFKRDTGSGDAVAGVGQSLAAAFAGDPDFRMLDGAITTIEQAMVVPVMHSSVTGALSIYVEARKADGCVRRALDESGMSEVDVATAR